MANRSTLSLGRALSLNNFFLALTTVSALYGRAALLCETKSLLMQTVDCLASHNMSAAAAGPNRTPQNVGCTKPLQWLLTSGHTHHVHIYSVKIAVTWAVTPCISKDMYQLLQAHVALISRT